MFETAQVALGTPAELRIRGTRNPRLDLNATQGGPGREPTTETTPWSPGSGTRKKKTHDVDPGRALSGSVPRASFPFMELHDLACHQSNVLGLNLHSLMRSRSTAHQWETIIANEQLWGSLNLAANVRNNHSTTRASGCR